MKRQKKELGRDQLRTWVEIDRKAIKNNFKIFRSLIPKGTLLCSAVKSNAYGHGLVEFSKEALKAGVDVLAVDSVIEGIRLREAGVKAPMFILGYTLPTMVKEAVKHDIEITIAGIEALKAVASLKLSKKIRVHLKIDSGMSRQGFFFEGLDDVLDIFDQTKHLKLVGIYTHMADAKNPAFPKNTYAQTRAFDRCVEHIRERGYNPLVHAAASSTTMLFPEAHYDMVRIGISSYGQWPSKETQAYAQDFIDLKPVMTWKTILADVKYIPKGAGISYGFTERVSKKTKIGILPIGYWHGYRRNLSSIGHVLINSKRARVLGLITMDITIVDLTNVPNPKVGDEVVLIGKQGKEEVTADELGYLLNTVNYEVVTQINPKIKRIVV